MNIGRWANLLFMKGSGILLATLGGTFLVQIPSVYKSEVDFQSKAISTTGTVVETREKKEERVYYSGGIPLRATTTKFISTVKFQTNQGESLEFTNTKACSSRRDCENKSVPVLYDPSFPLDARVDSGVTPEGKAKGVLVLSVVFLLPGIALVMADPDNLHTKPTSSHK